MAKCPFVNDTCNFLVSWCFDVCAWLDEASAPQHLVSLSNINRALWITLKDPEKLHCRLIQMFLSASHSRDTIRSEISGSRCTHSFIFMPLVNLPIYSRRNRRAWLSLTYCSVLGNMGPQEWELAYSCLIEVNKKCRVFFFFLHLFHADAKPHILYCYSHSRGQNKFQGQLAGWSFTLST